MTFFFVSRAKILCFSLSLSIKRRIPIQFWRKSHRNSPTARWCFQPVCSSICLFVRERGTSSSSYSFVWATDDPMRLGRLIPYQLLTIEREPSLGGWAKPAVGCIWSWWWGRSVDIRRFSTLDIRRQIESIPLAWWRQLRASDPRQVG